MYVSPRRLTSLLAGGWLLASATGAQAADGDDTEGTLEVDVVFPQNDTYAPSPVLPIVFAFQNPHLAPLLKPTINFVVWDTADMDGDASVSAIRRPWQGDMTGHNPYYETGGFNFTGESTYLFTWSLSWDNCRDEEDQTTGRPFHERNHSSGHFYFSTDKSAPKADLVAATSNKDKCGDASAFVFDVTGAVDVPSTENWGNSKQCGIVSNSSTPEPSPCKAAISSAAASNISAAITERACKATDPVIDDCPADDEGAASRLAVAGTAVLAAVFGAVGFLL